MADSQIQVYSDNITEVSKNPKVVSLYENVVPDGNAVLCTDPPSRIFKVSKDQYDKFKESVKRNYPTSIVQENMINITDVSTDISTYYKDYKL